MICDYSINTTYKCNWTCSYCLVDTHNQPDRPFEEVIADLMKLPDGCTLSLCGGEPGTLSPVNMDILFDIISHKKISQVDVLTNGLFIKRHKKHLAHVDTIHYHCVQSLDDDIIFYDLPDNVTLEYCLVVTTAEYDKLDTFLARYPHIVFDIKPARIHEALSKQQTIQIYKNHKHQMTQSSIYELFHPSCNPVGYN